MIHRTLEIWQTKSWQDELSNLITQPETLFELLNLDSIYLEPARQAAKHFPLRTTYSYASRIKKGDITDPLLRQILPIGLELDHDDNYVSDPLHETDFTPAPGLIHKYFGRVLLIAATQCAINCRYCFRRNFDYTGNKLSRKDWQTSLDYIRTHPTISEVILSGGDPLVMSDQQLRWLVNELSEIPHIDILRVHTRIPIVLPSRISDMLIQSLNHSRLKIVMVLHCNHADEIDGAVAEAAKSLATKGITLFNQAVLLNGVNDRVDSLQRLSHRLFDIGVIPYYLHLLDKVQGAQHFNIEEKNAKALYRELLNILPGYLVPKLVREVPGAKSKQPVLL